MSFLPKDPQHILMVLDGFNGRSLFKVDLETGLGEQMERPNENVVGWWLDVDGNPVVRVMASGGSIRLFRKDPEGKWRRFYTMRIREMKERPEYEAVGPSDQPGKYYVLARPPGRDRTGLYLYDLEKEVFGDPLFENPTYDLVSAQVSRDGKHVIRYCYSAHVQICSFSDAKIDTHMKGIRRYFEESANVYTFDSSEDGNTILLYVEGPREPPGYYIYLTEKRGIDSIGTERQALLTTTRPRATVINYKARDGKELTGYLTAPAAADAKTSLPLVLMPHGGPEMRDSLSFNSWVQYLVARGYAVFQPNFRGSDGFGRRIRRERLWRVGSQDAGRPHRRRQDPGGSGPGGSRARFALSARPTAVMPRLRVRRSRPICTNARCRSRVFPISTTSSAGANAIGVPTRRAIRTGSRRLATLTRTKRVCAKFRRWHRQRGSRFRSC